MRHNDPVGEFLLDGLAEVDAGNEILVHFDLDLDGILKVSAIERATGRQKQLTIDNAVTRFRAGNRQEALARVEATFLGGQEMGVQDSGFRVQGAEEPCAVAPSPPHFVIPSSPLPTHRPLRATDRQERASCRAAPIRRMRRKCSRSSSNSVRR